MAVFLILTLVSMDCWAWLTFYLVTSILITNSLKVGRRIAVIQDDEDPSHISNNTMPHVSSKRRVKPIGIKQWPGTMNTSYFLYGIKPYVSSRETYKTCKHEAVIGDDGHLSYYLYGIKPRVSSRATHKTCRHKAVIGNDEHPSHNLLARG
jgi:hypothetical protein